MVDKEWRSEKPTKKQINTIIKMQSIMGWTCDIPKTKGECCDRIKKLMNEADTRISITGTMGISRHYC